MLTHARLLELLRYNPETGLFVWRLSGFRRAAGEIAGHASKPHRYKGRSGYSLPYWIISVDGQAFFRAKLAWFYMTGQYPDFQVDHQDTDSLNDRWSNLRGATQALNNANRRTFKNNKLRLKGVHSIREGKYRAMISVDGKNRHLGYFETPESASKAYEMAASQAFGDFARAA